MGGDYLRYRTFYEDVSTNLTFTTATTTTTLITVKTSHTIYVQTIAVYIKTDAAQSLTFQDSAVSPVEVAKVATSPGASTKFSWDFGPKGMPLTEAKNLTATFSAAGLAGHLEVGAYQKLTAVAAA